MRITPISELTPPTFEYPIIPSTQQSPYFEDLHSIRSELRERRKEFLGSYASLSDMVCVDSVIDTRKSDILSKQLASRAAVFWKNRTSAAEETCYCFFRIAIFAIASGKVGNESIDDIIQLAECLVRSQSTFITVCKDLLPEDMISDLFAFTDTYSSNFFTSTFEDAVLGAIAVQLGMLKDPTSPLMDTTDKEVSAL